VRVKAFLHEPLVHFLAIGACLFFYFEWRGGGSGPDSKRITIDPGRIQHLAAGFARTWQRPPSEAELKGLIDDYVREEMAYREAVSMGLDRDDTVIRRRLRQKLEFLLEDAAAAATPTDAELQAWLDAHPAAFRTEPELALRQVYLNPDRRGRAITAEARALLGRLQAAGADAAIDGLGDSLMLPQEIERTPRREIARLFGEGFADRVQALEPGRWQGPVESGYGLHLVLVRERADGRLPPLDEVRPLVERELLSERRKRMIEQMYDGFLARYEVTLSPRDEALGAVARPSAPATAQAPPEGGR
jgi:hypothetical protein